jgi:hypothetical protein
MGKWIMMQVVLVALIGLMIGAQPAMAGSVSLADWCVNFNGDTTTACNGAGVGGPSGNGTISLSSFDTTIEPVSNALGTVTVTLGPGAGQFVSFYADYDVDFATYGSFDDYASVGGAQPLGWSYSVNDPGATDGTLPYGLVLFDQFYNNVLDNTNHQPTPSGPPSECCDVAFALSIGSINVAAGGSATATFVIGTTAPTSGFYIQQTNADTGDSIYLQGNVAGNNPVSGVPEPSTLALGLVGGCLLAWRRLRAAR